MAGSQAQRRDTEKSELRRALGSFVTGVTVVTTTDGQDIPRGLTANSFTSVSLEPPLVLVCIAHSAGSCDAFASSRTFAVNVLTEEQRWISRLFASKFRDRFSQIGYTRSRNGPPLIDGALAWLECRTYERLSAGDHLILIGEVSRFAGRSGTPLIYSQGAYTRLADGEANAARTYPLSVSCVVESDRQLLLERSETQAKDTLWSLPQTRVPETGSGPRSALKRKLESYGIQTDRHFLYATYECKEANEFVVVYRTAPVSFQRQLTDRMRWFSLSAIPWDNLKDADTFAMIERFVHELNHGAFGVYSHSDVGGYVARLAEEPEPYDTYYSKLLAGASDDSQGSRNGQ